MMCACTGACRFGGGCAARREQPAWRSPYYTPPPQPVFVQHGCICPPTSEQTCQSPLCPRKPFQQTTEETK